MWGQKYLCYTILEVALHPGWDNLCNDSIIDFLKFGVRNGRGEIYELSQNIELLAGGIINSVSLDLCWENSS